MKHCVVVIVVCVLQAYITIPCHVTYEFGEGLKLVTMWWGLIVLCATQQLTDQLGNKSYWQLIIMVLSTTVPHSRNEEKILAEKIQKDNA